MRGVKYEGPKEGEIWVMVRRAFTLVSLDNGQLQSTVTQLATALIRPELHTRSHVHEHIWYLDMIHVFEIVKTSERI